MKKYGLFCSLLKRLRYICGHSVFSNVRKSFGSLRKFVGNLRKCWNVSGNLGMTRRKSHSFHSEKIDRYNSETWIVRKTKKDRIWIISVKTCNCFCNTLVSSYRMLARSRRSASHLQQMVHLQQIINEIWHLRGSLPKSGQLDFATKNTFPLFFVG